MWKIYLAKAFGEDEGSKYLDEIVGTKGTIWDQDIVGLMV